jgi:glycosyltransferase involved in cell wall biosynthesis
MTKYSNPQITVITPVYNGDKFISETVESVLKCEKFVRIEYIVVNDGSTDRTREVLEQFVNRITLVEVENSGEAAAVNIGIKMASAPLVMVVSADDPVRDPAIFSESIEVHEQNAHVSVTYVDWAVINELGLTINHKKTKEFSLQELIGLSNCLPGPGAVFKTKLAREIGGRRTKYRFVSDYDFWLRLSAKGPFQRIPRELAQWRTHMSSTTVSAGGDDMAKERIQLIEEFIAANKFPERLNRQAISHAYYYAARLCLDFRISGPRRLLIKSLRIRRWWPEKANILVVFAVILYPLPREFLKLTSRARNSYVTNRGRS